MVDQLLAVMPAKYAVLLLAFLGVCAAADAWLPPTPPNSKWASLRKLLSLAAQNYGSARNIPVPPK